MKLTSIILMYTILHAILFSFIFWILTFLFKLFYSNKNYNYKLNFYECGFKSITNIKIYYNLNFILLILFILIYDGEFLLLIPFSLNIKINFLIASLVIIYFLIWLIVTLIIDYIYNALDWQV